MKKSIYFLLAAAVAFASCQKVEFNYTPDNEDVSFVNSSESYTLEGQKLEIAIVRGVADEALSLAIALDDEDGVFTLETPVINFAANEYEQKVVVSYDIADLAPAVKYSFAVSFDEHNKSAVGSNKFSASAMMPLEYEPYGEVTVYYSYISPLLPITTYKLNRAKYTTNYYMLEGLYTSKTELEFCVEGENFEILSKFGECKYFPSYPLFEVLTAANFSTYGPLTGWLDSDPEYCCIEGGDADGTLPEGSYIVFDVFWTVSAGYLRDTFTTEVLEVSKVY